jgi:7,8-dihydropterin-6-yl-methyl-4-(beta-D-ribofuranosyl)aminobenzene 5'-phosphate synthase
VQKEVAVTDLTITVLCDNNAFRKGIETSWGFSCFIEGMDRTVLFDSGNNPFLLLRNMEKTEIAPADIDSVLLSHMHWDHMGGLYGIIEKNNELTVFLPGSSSDKFKDDIKKHGAEIAEVREPVEICKDVFSTGESGESIKEQSLIVRTKKGLIVITGCAHPGVINIIEKARKIIGEEVLLVLGGFHLGAESKEGLKEIVSNFEKLNVEYVAPCHCTGKNAEQMFRAEYGDNFIRAGAGKVIKINCLREP